MISNNNLAKAIFDALYDDEDLKELKDKRVIAQEKGFKLSTIATIECELDSYNIEPVKESEWISVDSPEELPIGEEVLCWDGCQQCIDYAEMDGDTGGYYMANGTDIEAYMPLPKPPVTEGE